MIRIFILDDHQLFIDGLKNSLCNDPLLYVVGTATNGNDGMLQIDQVKPDIVILDIDFSKTHENGLDILRSIRTRDPHMKVLMLTGYYDLKLIELVQQSGAYGYLLKNIDISELRKALVDIHNGIYVFKYEMLDKPFNFVQPDSTLSERVIEILHYMAQGKSYKQIASELHISEATIKDHLDRAKKKLGVNSSLELLYIAGKKGYI